MTISDEFDSHQYVLVRNVILRLPPGRQLDRGVNLPISHHTRTHACRQRSEECQQLGTGP